MNVSLGFQRQDLDVGLYFICQHSSFVLYWLDSAQLSETGDGKRMVQLVELLISHYSKLDW